jgi:hypothetical protein
MLISLVPISFLSSFSHFFVIDPNSFFSLFLTACSPLVKALSGCNEKKELLFYLHNEPRVREREKQASDDTKKQSGFLLELRAANVRETNE